MIVMARFHGFDLIDDEKVESYNFYEFNGVLTGACDIKDRYLACRADKEYYIKKGKWKPRDDYAADGKPSLSAKKAEKLVKKVWKLCKKET